MRHGRIMAAGLLMGLSAALFLYGCQAMRTSGPLLPVSEYEKMIAGRMDANYVGDSACLAKCHAHDTINKYLDASTMGAQLSAESGMPLVNCESCHGPGSLAVENLKTVDGMECCDHDTFIDLDELPEQAQSLICLKCHSSNANFNLHNWNAGSHNMSGVSCSDCHKVHQSADLKVHSSDVAELCYGCHLEKRAEFMLPSRHPVNENQMTCLDCHNPHGTDTDSQLVEYTIKEVCTNCHSEKEGPFVYEHADVTDDCTNCHFPHGSVNDNLLTMRMPFLCKQCHAEHRLPADTNDLTELQTKQRFFYRCTDCHSQVHGSDTPSYGGGTFLQ
jgi:DmsE family decaheme c-type cytochrome